MHLRFPIHHSKPPLAPAIRRGRAGFSIVEISLVIATLLGLALFIGFGVNAVRDWRRAKDASIALQAVYAAQRGYLADHPAADISQVPVNDVRAYLPQGWTVMPAIIGLTGESLTIDYTVMPPVLLNGGAPYDPSARTNDGLWDVGE